MDEKGPRRHRSFYTNTLGGRPMHSPDPIEDAMHASSAMALFLIQHHLEKWGEIGRSSGFKAKEVNAHFDSLKIISSSVDAVNSRELLAKFRAHLAVLIELDECTRTTRLGAFNPDFETVVVAAENTGFNVAGYRIELDMLLNKDSKAA